MAHILNKPACFALAGRAKDGKDEPPYEWQKAVGTSHFHNITNVVPLCRKHHRRFDNPKDPRITHDDIVRLRNEAIKRPEALARLLDFACTELRGRPGRCQHKDKNGKRPHSHMADTKSAALALHWVSRGYVQGILSGPPQLIVESVGGSHCHLDLCSGGITHTNCSANDCSLQKAPLWIPPRNKLQGTCS